jgi:hypothetical protein
MEELKTSTRMMVLCAIIMLVILLTGPLGYKFGFIPLLPSLASLMLALIGSVLVLVAAMIFVFIAVRNDMMRNRNMLLLVMVLSLVPMIIMGPQIVKGRSVPAIHDITTDTDNPPEFLAMVKHRVHASNGLAYGTEDMPAAELAAVQLAAYPDVKHLQSELSVADALARSESVLKGHGLEIVSTDSEAGLVEATATTFWFGFKDDVVVRVVANAAGSRIDIRSVSRVGQGDIGANAARIEKFLGAF